VENENEKKKRDYNHENHMFVIFSSTIMIDSLQIFIYNKRWKLKTMEQWCEFNLYDCTSIVIAVVGTLRVILKL
jgi:hypothetical protein